VYTGSKVWNMSPIGIGCSEVWNMSPIRTVGWYMIGAHPESNSMHECLLKVESLVSLFVSYVWCEMNYERLNCCCFVEIEIQFMKIYIFFKNSLAYPYFCVLFVFVFLKLRWSCILHVNRGFDRWCESVVS